MLKTRRRELVTLASSNINDIEVLSHQNDIV